MEQKQLAAQQALEHKFRQVIDRDVSTLAVEHCQSEGLRDAAILCRDSNEYISNCLWSCFAFDWSDVTPNPGGTVNQASRFVEAKFELTVAWAVARRVKTAEVAYAEDAALMRLQKLWGEWVGYMVTTSEAFEVAISTQG